jgi:hypothetical protein
VVPFHHAIDQDQVEFIVQRLKEATINSGAGAAIY